MARISALLGVWPNLAAGEEGTICTGMKGSKGMLYWAMTGAAQLPCVDMYHS
jgi:hypothetical protein